MLTLINLYSNSSQIIEKIELDKLKERKHKAKLQAEAQKKGKKLDEATIAQYLADKKLEDESRKSVSIKKPTNSYEGSIDEENIFGMTNKKKIEKISKVNPKVIKNLDSIRQKKIEDIYMKELEVEGILTNFCNFKFY